MLKKLLLILTFLIAPVSATQYTSLGYAHINQDLFGTIEFDLPAVLVSHTWIGESGLGIRAQVGSSTETSNTLEHSVMYRARISDIYGIQAIYKHDFRFFKLYGLVGKTDYHTDWKVNGETPSWSGGADSDWSYHGGIEFDIYPKFSISFEYADIYRKNKAERGKEKTNYYSIHLNYFY